MRSGLKIVITRTTIKENFAPSRSSLIFDEPTRGRASVGSKATLYPALMNASKCPDLVTDRGHDYVFIGRLSDEEKKALIELLKTF